MNPRERVFALEQFGIKLGLDNVARLLAALERPEQAWRAIHVAGTNGKGSVTAMVERALRAAGHRTGRYTSPHLNDVEERIAIDGAPITRDEFDAVASDVMATVDRLRDTGDLPQWPTFFETTTAMAFETFRRHGVDVGVIEVGLGGRFDATNVLRPIATAITSIALDHERHLGSTLQDIAREKAGIIKPGVPIVAGMLPPPAMSVIRQVADTARAPLWMADESMAAPVRLRAGRATIDLTTPVREYGEVTLGLNGAHQVANAVVAARVLEAAETSGIAVGPGQVRAGLQDVDWPGRLEWLRVGVDQFALIDAAHNPEGAAALAAYLGNAALGKLPIVIGIMQDKNADAMVRALAPAVSTFVVTEAATARSMPAAALGRLIAGLLPTPVVERADAIAAVAAALSISPAIVVAGSILLAGPVRATLIARGAEAVPFPSAS